MIYYAVVFGIVALVAGVLGFSGISGAAANIAWILFIVGLVVAVVFFIRGSGHDWECDVCKRARRKRASIKVCGTCHSEF